MNDKDLPAYVEGRLLTLGVPPTAPLVAAVSGGGDSMALLVALTEGTATRERLRAGGVGHVDHGLRADSPTEAEFVRTHCARLDVPFHLTTLALRADGGGNLADRLREARYAFLMSLLPAQGVLLTAHHADDQAVTLLMRLVEGAALPGLAGIPPRRGAIVRPLLNVPRATLQAFLRDHGVPWCEDPSNADLKRYRNRIRTELWPLIQREQPAAPALLAAVAARLREDDEALENQAQETMSDLLRGWNWVEVALPQLPPAAILRRLIARVLRETWALPAPSGEQWSAVAEGLARRKRVNLPGRATLQYAGPPTGSHSYLLFQREIAAQAYAVDIAGPGSYTLPVGTLRVLSTAQFPQRLLARPWEPGDSVTRATGAQRVRVAEQLRIYGVPGHRRLGWPVLVDAVEPTQVVFIPPPFDRGLGPSAAGGQADFDVRVDTVVPTR